MIAATIPTKPSTALRGRSLQDVAKALGVSAAEVARIEQIALLKLRRECERKGLSINDFLSLIYPTLP